MASGTFTSGAVGTVITVENAMDVEITQGSLLTVDTSSTTVMEYTVGLVYAIDPRMEK